MKSFFFAAVTVSMLATPAVSLAQQSGSPVTREQVKAELMQLEQAGYNPIRRDSALSGRHSCRAGTHCHP